MSNSYNKRYMNAEVSAPSVSAPTLAGGQNPTVGGEFSPVGVDYSSSFSGLGRSDFNATPSMNQSIFNSGETRPFTAGPMNTPEGPVKGDVFGQTEVIAAGPKQESVEQHVLAEANRLGVEDLRTNDPLAYQQLKSDLKIVDNILDLVDQVDADNKTVVRISNQAVESAVKRSGLIQEALQEPTDAVSSSDETETEPEAEAQTEAQQTKTDEETEVAYADVEVEADQIQLVARGKNEKPVVRDEDANKARIEDRKKALRDAAEQDVDSKTGKLEGKAVLERVIAEENEQSDLARSQGVEDGSIPEADRVIAQSEFESMDQAERVIFKAVEDNTGVKRGNAGQRATDGEVKKVLKGRGTNRVEDQLPKAA